MASPASIMRATFDPTRINAIVVLSDGANDWPSARTAGRSNDVEYTDMEAVLTADAGPTIPAFTIAYGGEADRVILGQIAGATNAETYNASNPADIADVFVKVLSNS